MYNSKGKMGEKNITHFGMMMGWRSRGENQETWFSPTFKMEFFSLSPPSFSMLFLCTFLLGLLHTSVVEFWPRQTEQPAIWLLQKTLLHFWRGGGKKSKVYFKRQAAYYFGVEREKQTPLPPSGGCFKGLWLAGLLLGKRWWLLRGSIDNACL